MKKPESPQFMTPAAEGYRRQREQLSPDPQEIESTVARRASRKTFPQSAAEEYRKQRQQGPNPNALFQYQQRKLRKSVPQPHQRQKPSEPSRPTLLHPLLPALRPTPVRISVVLGTYNRKELLIRCIESVRRACGKLSYQIIVCDGGSSDGSIRWLQSQADVVYIPGDLSGAVAAFNAAARKAQGEFILAVNDDAELDPMAVVNALQYFKDPLVGQVALSFREHGKWKLERVHGKIYANFAMTRTNIVRAVEKITGGMWSPCYRTYGGDTELSCWVYRLGYEVVGAQDAKLLHEEHVDDLRRKNLRTDKERQQFTHRWYKEAMQFRGPLPRVGDAELEVLQQLESGEGVEERWARIESIDPVFGEMPLRVQLRPENVLHWQLWTADDPQTSMVKGLRSLGRVAFDVVRWTTMVPEERDRAFVQAAKVLRPSVMFLQCQDPGAVSVEAIREVRNDPKRNPSLVIAIWSGDIGPGKGPWKATGDKWQYLLSEVVDLMLFTGTGQVQEHRSRGMHNAAYLQIGYDVDRYYPGPREEYGTMHDIVFMGQNYGPQFNGVPTSEAQLRRHAVEALSTIKGFSAYGSGFGPPMPQAKSGDIYRRSLMAVSISLVSSLGRYSSDRLLRSMACGTATLVKRFTDMEGMGLRDGQNCIGWDTPEELRDRAEFWLSPRRREQLLDIGQAGAQLMEEHHTWDVRMEEFQALIDTVRGQR